MKCPKCDSRLQPLRVELHPAVIGTGTPPSIALEIAQCETCAGVWFEEGGLERYLSEHGDRIPEKAILPSVLRDLDERVANCPSCGKTMEKKYTRAHSEVRVDHCLACGGYWLDDGEVQRLTEDAKTGAVLFGGARSRLEKIFRGWLPLARH